MNNFAYLKEDCPFFGIFWPSGAVPIKNIVLPNQADCENGGGIQDVYMVDLDKLNPKQLDNVIRLVHQMCTPEGQLEITRKEIMARGLPLRAKHVRAVSSDVPFFL